MDDDVSAAMIACRAEMTASHNRMSDELHNGFEALRVEIRSHAERIEGRMERQIAIEAANYISVDRYEPVERTVFGLVAVILSGIVLALLALLLRGQQSAVGL